MPIYGSVEFEFLRVDRVKDMEPAEEQGEEDEHCVRMRRLGARWYPTFEAFVQEGERSGRKRVVVVVGWAEGGGVWVLRCEEWEVMKRGVGRVFNAVSMTERCEVIEALGGVFYADERDCPDLEL